MEKQEEDLVIRRGVKCHWRRDGKARGRQIVIWSNHLSILQQIFQGQNRTSLRN